MPVEHSQIKIAIVDDHNLFRKGLIKLIGLADSTNKYTVLFEAENGNVLKDKLSKKNQPDIILMDIDMPDMNGYETVDWLKRFYPEISILVISMFESEEAIIRMLKLGVNGYLSKDIEIEDMHAALEAISNKGFYYTETVTSVMANSIQNNSLGGENANGANSFWATMSENEREFLKLACTELTYSEIAEKMNLSPKTIDGYREILFQRFLVKNRVSLAMFAVRNGLVKL
jgi:two-component system, NarL family, invasion response regulator UvrY